MLAQRHDEGAFGVRVLGSSDLDGIVALHNDVRLSLPDSSFLSSQKSSFFEALILADGIAVGAFHGRRLVAYGGVILPGARTLRRSYDVAHLSIDGSALAFGAGCGVHPQYRRSGLFRRLISERTHAALQRGCSHITAVVSLRNEASLRALHDLGHAAAGLHHDEDGANFLLIRPTAAPFSADLRGAVEIPVASPEENLFHLQVTRAVGLPLHSAKGAVFAYIDPVRIYPSNPVAR